MDRKIKTPRSFKLLEEYDNAVGKGAKTKLKGKHQGFINYGLAEFTRDTKDPLGSWKGIIIGIQGKNSGQLIYTFTVSIPSGYPDVAPVVRFKGPKMDMPAIDRNGNVDLAKISPSFKWKADLWIADALMAIRNNMENPATLKTCEARAREGNYF